MKLLSSLLTLSLLTPSVSLTSGSMGKETYHYDRPGIFDGPTMWVFGSTGLHIYNPDGSQELVQTPPEEICHNVTGYRGGPASLSCSFYDVVSDGKKYVWASVSRGVSKVDVFDIDTGAIVGSFPTCNTPRDLEYHPLRDEIWARCMATADENGGYMNVLSAESPTGDVLSTVDFTGNHTLRAYGYSVIDNSLGDVGYATVWGQNTLYKIDLSERTILEPITMPIANDVYEVAYSRLNRHIFVRASVCCSCGFAGSDMGEDCGRYGSSNVTMTTGPNAGKIVQGQCGRCDGLPVDNIGVYEFDTTTDTIVSNHLMPDGTGGDPFASPDGRHIVLVGRNGGEVLRILRTGQTGQKSTVAYDLELGFTTTNAEKTAVYNDFAFIQTDETDDGVVRDMIVIASGTENKVALVDLLNIDANGKPSVVTLNLGSNEELTANRNRRQVEWVVGTPYVWIDGASKNEVYVVHIDQKKNIRTIEGPNTAKMITIENYERKRIAKLVADQITLRQQVTSDANKEQTQSETSVSQSTQSSQSTLSMSQASSTLSDSGSKRDSLSVAALIVGICAIVVGVANMIAIKKIPKKKGATTDEASLGSKNIA